MLKYLSFISDSLKENDERNKLPVEKIEEIEQYVQEYTAAILSRYDENTESTEMLTACFRILRNACADCHKNQDALKQQTFVTTSSAFDVLCQRLYTQKKDKQVCDAGVVCLRCGVQFMGNAVTNHQINQELAWNSSGTALRYLLLVGDEKLSDYTCMVLFNCQGQWIESYKDLFNDIVAVLTRVPSDWALLIFERLLHEKECLSLICEHPDSDVSESLLELVIDKLKSQEEKDTVLNEDAVVHKSNITATSKQFKSDAHTILGLSQGEVCDLNCIRVTQLLSLLCTATSQREAYKELLEDTELLKCTINLLHCMQMIGASGDNAFSNVSKLSDMQKTDHGVHPVFGLKSNLIRLIANMVYRHRNNQDLVREMGGIQQIMNHTNIDGRNPFITQWAVFAMRNILEDNEENKAVVAELKLEGTADNLEALREFGVDAEMQGDKIVIKQVRKPELNEPSPFAKPE